MENVIAFLDAIDDAKVMEAFSAKDDVAEVLANYRNLDKMIRVTLDHYETMIKFLSSCIVKLKRAGEDIDKQQTVFIDCKDDLDRMEDDYLVIFKRLGGKNTQLNSYSAINQWFMKTAVKSPTASKEGSEIAVRCAPSGEYTKRLDNIKKGMGIWNDRIGKAKTELEPNTVVEAFFKWMEKTYDRIETQIDNWAERFHTINKRMSLAPGTAPAKESYEAEYDAAMEGLFTKAKEGSLSKLVESLNAAKGKTQKLIAVAKQYQQKVDSSKFSGKEYDNEGDGHTADFEDGLRKDLCKVIGATGSISGHWRQDGGQYVPNAKGLKSKVISGDLAKYKETLSTDSALYKSFMAEKELANKYAESVKALYTKCKDAAEGTPEYVKRGYYSILSSEADSIVSWCSDILKSFIFDARNKALKNTKATESDTNWTAVQDAFLFSTKNSQAEYIKYCRERADAFRKALKCLDDICGVSKSHTKSFQQAAKGGTIDGKIITKIYTSYMSALGKMPELTKDEQKLIGEHQKSYRADKGKTGDDEDVQVYTKMFEAGGEVHTKASALVKSFGDLLDTMSDMHNSVEYEGDAGDRDIKKFISEIDGFKDASQKLLNSVKGRKKSQATESDTSIEVESLSGKKIEAYDHDANALIELLKSYLNLSKGVTQCAVTTVKEFDNAEDANQCATALSAGKENITRFATSYEKIVKAAGGTRGAKKLTDKCIGQKTGKSLEVHKLKGTIFGYCRDGGPFAELCKDINADMDQLYASFTSGGKNPDSGIKDCYKQLAKTVEPYLDDYEIIEGLVTRINTNASRMMK